MESFGYYQPPEQDPQLPSTPPAAPVSPPPARPVSGKRDVVLAVLLVVVNILLADTLLFADLGLFAGILLAIQLGLTLWYLWRAKRSFGVYSCFCACGALALAVSMVFSADQDMKALALLGILVLSTILLIDLMRQRRWEAGTFQSVGDVCVMMFGRTFGKIGAGCYGLFHARQPGGAVRGRRIGSVLLGVACALPALIIIVPLLISSDAAFEGLVSSLQPLLLIKHLFAGALGLLLALLLFSQLFHLPHTDPIVPRGFAGGRLPPALVTSFLGVLSVVYLTYLISQGAYFLDSFRGLLPDGYSVAEYARRGFFELCALGVLNLGFVLLAALLCSRKGKLLPLPARLLACFLCVFSLGLTVASVSKMALYIQSFGMTRPRILATAFMLVLGCLFVAAALRLFIPRIPYLKVAAVAATLTVLVLSFANVDRIIASYNVRAYQDGRLKSVDVSTLCELSDAAVPYLLELTEDPDPAVAREARTELQARTASHFSVHWHKDGSCTLTDDKYDLRSFNTDLALARSLLQANADRIMEGYQTR